MLPEKLGRYQIIAATGDNALGATYLGNDPLLKRKAVLQTVRVDPAVADRSGAPDHFLKDIKAVERLSHVNIATVYDCGQEGDLAYIATEFLDGRDLRELIVRGHQVDLAPPDGNLSRCPSAWLLEYEVVNHYSGMQDPM